MQRRCMYVCDWLSFYERFQYWLCSFIVESQTKPRTPPRIQLKWHESKRMHVRCWHSFFSLNIIVLAFLKTLNLKAIKIFYQPKAINSCQRLTLLINSRVARLVRGHMDLTSFALTGRIGWLIWFFYLPSSINWLTTDWIWGEAGKKHENSNYLAR